MNVWLWAATALLLCLIPCGIVCVRAQTPDRLAAAEMAGVLAILIVMLLAQGYQRPSLYDLALALALLSYPGSLVFAHFLERWL